MDGVTDNLAAALDKNMSGAGNTLGSSLIGGLTTSLAGTALTKTVTKPLLNVGKQILSASMDFEAGMSSVQAISGATEDSLAALTDEAMRMAAQTKFDTAEAAEAYKYMAMAGWETEDMLNSLSAVMYLAGASGESLGSTSDIVTDAMTAFGLAADENSRVLKNGYEVEVSNAQRFTDVLAAASNNANTNVALMGETFKYVAPVAGAVGYSIEDVAIAAGLMANSGVKASMAGTALRSVITNLSKPTDTVKSAMQTLGITMEDSEGNTRSLMDVMMQLRESFSGGTLSQEEYLQKLTKINEAAANGDISVGTYEKAVSDLTDRFDLGEISQEEYDQGLQKIERDLSIGLLSTGEYQSAIDDLTISMYGAEGAQKAQLAAAIAGKYGMAGFMAIVDASDEDFDKLTEAICNSNGATQEMYEIMTDNAEGAVTMLNSALNVLFTSLGEFLIPAFTDLVRNLTDVVNWFNQLDDGTKQFILTIAGIAIAVGPVLTVVGNLVTVFGLLTGGLGTAATGVGALVGAFSGGGGLTAVTGLASKAVSALGAVFSFIAANPIVLLVAAIAGIVAVVVQLWNTNEDFRDAVKDIWEAIKGFFVDAWNGIKEAFDGVGEFFAGIGEDIKNAFDGIGEWFAELFQSAAEGVRAAWEGITEFFIGVWEGIQGVWDNVVEFFSGLFSDAWEAIKSVWEGVSEFFGGVWENIQGAFASVGEWFSTKFTEAKENALKAWDNIKERFSEIWGKITDAFNIKDALQWGKDMIGNFISGITAKWEALKDTVSNVAQTVKDFLGFSEPKEGPLSNFHTYAPDMMALFAQGIRDNANLVTDQLESAFNFQEPVLNVGGLRMNPASGEFFGGSNRSGGGNTYNFYSPKALDPVSAAREMKKTAQQMALGYV